MRIGALGVFLSGLLLTFGASPAFAQKPQEPCCGA